ncbi:MAG: hypothetical protein F6K50_09395 [Moorea sp. SIO3I7]|uniref:hypothetical protein n=1 Tax=unclassified Moorena TaxID=2683338 RepID=UPI0013C1F18A|nr:MULTISPECIES: hypothetical protein [unclassified Moorena]NEN95736.1 hypothetical protein [Moorena sp. SIO3I7]NEO09564.1 hypothetical protein [Moorena sp. SIO3I8]NEO62517.1 hypothetical protein [Moorena sp. SIO4G2]NEP25430.1 hypothetical protein [Moorena sp. SIO3I6]
MIAKGTADHRNFGAGSRDAARKGASAVSTGQTAVRRQVTHTATLTTRALHQGKAGFIENYPWLPNKMRLPCF